jgi:hypothetical protein
MQAHFIACDEDDECEDDEKCVINICQKQSQDVNVVIQLGVSSKNLTSGQ